MKLDSEIAAVDAQMRLDLQQTYQQQLQWKKQQHFADWWEAL